VTSHAPLRANHDPGRPRRFERDARDIIRLLGPLGQRMVPASTTMHFGAWLGWPEWLRTGTSLDCTGPLPASLRTDDDLLIIANLLDFEGAGRILARSLQDIRYPVGPLAGLALANAPTLREALRAYARLTNIHRDYFRAELDERGPGVRLLLGQRLPQSELSDVIALLILILAYRLVASYSFSLAEPGVLRCMLARDPETEPQWPACHGTPQAGARVIYARGTNLIEGRQDPGAIAPLDAQYLRPTAASAEHGLKGEYFRGKEPGGEVMLTRIAPVSPQLILCFIAERALGLPRSY